MTGTVIKPALRRTATVAAATVTLLSSGALLAGPASAKVPVGWGTQEPVDMPYALAVLAGGPIVLALLITAAVYLPGIVRGERVSPGATGPQDQWLGGRRNAGEIEFTPTTGAEPALTASGERVETDGGASARW